MGNVNCFQGKMDERYYRKVAQIKTCLHYFAARLITIGVQFVFCLFYHSIFLSSINKTVTYLFIFVIVFVFLFVSFFFFIGRTLKFLNAPAE